MVFYPFRGGGVGAIPFCTNENSVTSQPFKLNYHCCKIPSANYCSLYANKEALQRRTHSPSGPRWGTADPKTFSAQMKTLSPVNTDCHLNSIITVASYPLPIIAVCMLI